MYVEQYFFGGRVSRIEMPYWPTLFPWFHSIATVTCRISLEGKFYPLSESNGIDLKSRSQSAYGTPERRQVKRRILEPKYLRPKYMPQCRDVFTHKGKSLAYNPIHRWKAL